MGIKRQWKIAKLSQLSMEKSLRMKLIESIMRRQRPKVTLYAWDAPPIANQAFFTERDAVTDWYVKNRVWEDAIPPSGVVLHKWEMSVDDLVRYAKDSKLRKVDIPPTVEMEVGIIPSSLHEDMQRTLEKQP